MNRYVILYKPFNVLSQFTSDEGVRNLSEFDLPKEIYAAGRLDKDSEGLLLLTNDGPLIKKLLEPTEKTWKTYWVQVEKIPAQEDLKKLEQGVLVQGKKTLPCKARILGEEINVPDRIPPIRERKSIPTCWIELKIREGRNRQVRRMTAAIGFPTLRLIRHSIANLTLDNLNPGEWIEIKKQDIKLESKK
jgi:23S rRNA pseudouridine2457 synthase